MTSLFTLWEYLTTPSSYLQGEAWRQARLLMSMLVVLVVLSITGGLHSIYNELQDEFPNYGSLFLVNGIAITFFFTYLLSRTRHYTWASTLFVLAPMVVIAIGAILSEGESGTYFLYFLVLTPIFASLLLSVRATWVVSIVNFTVFSFLLIIVPGWGGANTYDELIFNITVPILLIVSATIRQNYLKKINHQMEELEQAKQAERAAREKAERSDQIKSAFLASMSHELRTPLNAIINFTQFVVEGDLGEVNPKQEQALNQVIKSSRLLLNLINDVLDVSKIESGTLNLFIENEVPLNPLLESVISTGRSLITHKKVEIRAELARDLPPIRCDRQRVLQILLNIMSNACKFTETGFIRVCARRTADEIVIDFEDTGPGINAEDQTSVFKPFHQTQVGVNQGGGTGLGMSISRSLAEAHGGRLWFESEAGKGATFHVALPIRNEKLVPVK